MPKTRFLFSLLSILFSTACITALLIQNYHLANTYILSDRKTKALFGIIELSHASVKIYFAPLALLSAFFILFAWKKKEEAVLRHLSLLFWLMAVACFFIRIWVWMI